MAGGERSTEEPQRVDSSRADAEWKADPGLKTLVHGEKGDSEVDRSSKAAPLPKGDFDNNADIAHGDGNAAGNLTGDGKGPLDPDESVPKKKQDL